MWKIAGPAIQKSEWDLERTTGQKRKRNDMGLLNEMTWLQMMEDQTNNEKCVAEALAKLLEEMKLLRRIEIFPPQISDKLFEGAGSLDRYSSRTAHYSRRIRLTGVRMTKNSGYQTSKASIFRKDVGEALLRAKRNVTELHIRPFKVDAKRSPPGLVHMMGQLQDLDIELTDQGFLLENKPISPLRDMLRASQHSLRSLRMAFSGLPDRGVHCITKVLFEDDGNTPMSFPNLETFSIPDIILRSQPVADFISAQPRLRRLETRNVRLASPGFKWMDAVAVFPKTMKEWFIDAVGHDPDLDCPKPIAYNHVELWLADEDADLARAGWQKDPEEQTRWGLYTRH